MAIHATLSPVIVVRSTKLHYSCSFPASLPCLPQTSHLYLETRNPRTSICQSKLNGSAGEEPEELDQSFFDGNEEMGEDESEEDETESSIDLFFRFLQSVFKKVSKRAKKATRSVLPMPISPQLVSFAVDGVILLTSLSIVKALLEVVCTVGGTVLAVILILRMIWSAISHFQTGGNSFNQGGTSYGTT